MSSSSERTVFLVLTVVLLALAVKVAAEERPEVWRPPVCEPPISTCRTLPEAASEVPLAGELCPPGATCICVPSCPECDDCAASVCVPEQRSECRSACDCAPGLGCFDGRCIAGITQRFAPVFCCDGGTCPTGQLCQERGGEMGRCEDAMEVSCRRRLDKVQRRIGRWVERASACEVDADCVRVETSTECLGTCGEFVNRRFADRIERGRQKLDRRVCSDYQADGCPYATPTCVSSSPHCVKGRCQGSPFGSQPGVERAPSFDLSDSGTATIAR